MSCIQLRAVRGQTGRLLAEMLTEAGLEVNGPNPQGVVCYGAGNSGGTLPTLNGNAGRLNKYQELVRLREKGIPVPDHTMDRSVAMRMLPVLGREFHHQRGLRIRMGRLALKLPQSDFFTKYIEKAAEYRVFAFRGNNKGLYQKVKRYERTGKRPPFVWDRANGYAFEFVHPDTYTNVHRAIVGLGTASVGALDLDFGAVDIITDLDRVHYVLEVNTAPGVEGRRQGISAFSRSIVKWASSGFPKRKGEADADQG